MRTFLSILLTVFSVISLNAQEQWDLQRCINYAFDNNVSVMQTALGVNRSEVGLKQGKLGLLPNLNTGATYGFNFGQRIDPFTNQFASERVATSNLFLSSSLDVFNGFSKRNDVKSRAYNLEASKYDLESIKNDISLQVCLSYLQILQNKESLSVAKNQVKLTQQQVDRMKKLVDVGQMPRGNLFDLESQLAQERLNEVTAENAVNLAILSLTQLLQLEPNEAQNFDIVKPNLTDEGVELLSNSAEDIYLKAKSMMPQVQAAEARQTSAEYALSSSQGQLYPSLQLSGSIGSGYSELNEVQIGEGENIGQVPIGEVLTQGNPLVVSLQPQTVFSDSDFETKGFGDQLEDNFNQNLTLTLSIPIFNGWSAKANVERAKINQVDADLSYRQITNQLRFDIEQAYADAKAAMNTYLASEQAVKALEESFKYAEVRYEQEVINAVDFNTTKTQYTNAQVDKLRAKYDFVFRTKILDFYLGNPITL
ncbi:MAG: TolC family protein [Flavobacteriales bacterium]|nr:TolC family protein [Flavobacteriales bacterium]